MARRIRWLSRLTPVIDMPTVVVALICTELSRGVPMPGVSGRSSVPGVFSCATVRCASSYAATTGTSGATATLLAFCPGNSRVRQV